MRRIKIGLLLPEALRDEAARQAAVCGVSFDLFLEIAVAARVRAQAETARIFAARGARTTPARAKALLGRLGMWGRGMGLSFEERSP